MKGTTRSTEVQIMKRKQASYQKKIRIMIVKMIKNLERNWKKMQQSINKDLEELKNKHKETNNTTT